MTASPVAVAETGSNGVEQLGPQVTICQHLDGLAAIQKPAQELVIWRRPHPLAFRSWIEQIATARLPDVRLLVHPSALRDALAIELDACKFPSGDMRDLMLADIDTLVSVFSQITGSDQVDVRLERVGDDACWKFHRDCVEARLLTTYRGPATEWVDPVHAEAALRDQRDYRGPLERFQTHDVAVFKGSCAGTGSGIVHRSPPLAGTGITRLLLCLNTPSATSPEPWQHG